MKIYPQTLILLSLLLPSDGSFADDLERCLAVQFRILSENDFNVVRPLGDYELILGAAFRRHLKSLTPSSRWIDFGAGTGNAQAQFAKKKGKESPELLAIVHRFPERYEKNQAIPYLEGRLIEDIPNAEIGGFDMGTDLFGPFSYSDRIDEVLQKYLDTMKLEGRLYLHHFDLNTEKNHYTKIITKDGKHLTINQWLRRIPGLSIVTNEFDDLSFTNIIEKTKENIVVPKLVIQKLEPGKPPQRVFREI